MNICVLIGNGFDLALGLKTGYESFIAEYLKDHRASTNPDVKWLCDTIEENIETWGDAEIAFGKLPFDAARQKAVDTYRASEEDFSVSFQEYLQHENSRFFIPPNDKEDSKVHLLQHLLEVSNWMTSGHKEKCRLVNVGEATVDFINFNYTDTLWQILGDMPSTVRIAGERPITINLNSLCHVHGTLESGVLFGVDRPSQIADPSVRDYCARTGETVKPRGADMAGFSEHTHGENILKNADVVITFGLSFGASDTSWWQKLWAAVFRGGSHSQLIVCPYSRQRPVHILGNRMVRIYAEEKKKVFHSFAGRNENANLESTTAERIIVLQPMPDEEDPYDYFHLAGFKSKYLDKGYNLTGIAK